ncbi:Rac GTPase-activating protein 1 [Acetobacter orientalis]|uniref:Rac GTPase-activating protein 1 n=1 Tax=Acetobacter orientalis TaxID=146474 RepID=A0A2Z5ZHD9_9PROT|nr:Rac GTPase-activating protein 1 [Acetobacter orientalis]
MTWWRLSLRFGAWSIGRLFLPCLLFARKVACRQAAVRKTKPYALYR